MKNYIVRIVPFFFLCIALTPHNATASELQYGALKDQYGSTILIEYKGPAGTQYFTCTTKGTCAKKGKNMPALFPAILGTTNYERSADGRLAIRSFALNTTTHYFLYDMSKTKPKKIAQIPYTASATKIYFTKNNNAVIFRNATTYTRYDIKSGALETIAPTQNLAFFSISSNGTYVTGYNYGTQRHELWRFSDGKKLEGPASMQSYLEFSEDDSEFAFLEDIEGFKTLFTMDAKELGATSPSSLTKHTAPNTEVEDYLYIGNTLYYMANVDGPLEWDLFSYDGKKTTVVDTDVSYGDFLKRVRTGNDASFLAYLKTTGKNTNVILYDGGKKIELAPIKASPAPTDLTREVKVYGDRTGVLLTPKKLAKTPSLFIWLHGGPQRQVAKGYHPYLSYAVYDELLERLTSGGNYVYKIDYTGSTGYGADFRKALDMNIGKVEMQDIRNAVRDLKKDFPAVKNVYLIGNSYGGYMAFRGIVDAPKEIAGAVSINGVSDWYGLIERIPSSPFKELFDGVPDTHNLDAYLQASVFTGMEKLTNKHKVFVVWGAQDSTVPVWQSTNYLEYADTQNVSTKRLTFADEDHIIRKRTNLDKLCTETASYLGIRGVSCKLPKTSTTKK